jgi:hypothetical protein
MRASTFLIISGLIWTLGAVGIIETDGNLWDGILFAALGLGIMGCGVLMLRGEQPKRPVDNPTLW